MPAIFLLLILASIAQAQDSKTIPSDSDNPSDNPFEILAEQYQVETKKIIEELSAKDFKSAEEMTKTFVDLYSKGILTPFVKESDLFALNKFYFEVLDFDPEKEEALLFNELESEFARLYTIKAEEIQKSREKTIEVTVQGNIQEFKPLAQMPFIQPSQSSGPR